MAGEVHALGTATTKAAGNSLTLAGVTVPLGATLEVDAAFLDPIMAAAIDSITWGSTSLAPLIQPGFSGLLDAERWFADQVAAGTHDIVVTYSSSLFAKALAARYILGSNGDSGSIGGSSGTGSSTSPDAGNNGDEGDLQTGVVFTNGPVEDTAGTWSGGWTGDQRAGTTGGLANTNITVSDAYNLSVGIGQAAKTGITSRQWTAMGTPRFAAAEIVCDQPLLSGAGSTLTPTVAPGAVTVAQGVLSAAGATLTNAKTVGAVSAHQECVAADCGIFSADFEGGDATALQDVLVAQAEAPGNDLWREEVGNKLVTTAPAIAPDTVASYGPRASAGIEAFGSPYFSFLQLVPAVSQAPWRADGYYGSRTNPGDMPLVVEVDFSAKAPPVQLSSPDELHTILSCGLAPGVSFGSAFEGIPIVGNGPYAELWRLGITPSGRLGFERNVLGEATAGSGPNPLHLLLLSAPNTVSFDDRIRRAKVVITASNPRRLSFSMFWDLTASLYYADAAVASLVVLAQNHNISNVATEPTDIDGNVTPGPLVYCLLFNDLYGASRFAGTVTQAAWGLTDSVDVVWPLKEGRSNRAHAMISDATKFPGDWTLKADWYDPRIQGFPLLWGSIPTSNATMGYRWVAQTGYVTHNPAGPNYGGKDAPSGVNVIYVRSGGSATSYGHPGPAAPEYTKK